MSDKSFIVEYESYNPIDPYEPIKKRELLEHFVDDIVGQANHLEEKVKELEGIIKLLLMEIVQVRGTDFNIVALQDIVYFQGNDCVLKEA